jgi:hypothetical protein
MSGEGIVGTRSLEDLFDREILTNFGRHVDKKAETDGEKAEYYKIISNALYLIEYEQMFNMGLKEPQEPQFLSLDNESILADMNFSRYKPETRFEDIRVDKNMLPGSWSRKIGYFPIGEKELSKISSIGRLTERLFEKRREML